jgi:response regulator RpfG family c-di-GMP phosphodiesterase
MLPGDQDRVRQIARQRWTGPDGSERDLLDEEELRNLTVRFGTLTDAERKIINNHISVTIRMLESLPWPKHLKNVPEYAGGHHERMDGKGYPRGLTRDEMSVQARIMAIADIFEALTAADRPYKKGKMLSESLAHPRQVRRERPYRPGPVRHFRPREGLPEVRARTWRRTRSMRSTRALIPGYRA